MGVFTVIVFSIHYSLTKCLVKSTIETSGLHLLKEMWNCFPVWGDTLRHFRRSGCRNSIFFFSFCSELAPEGRHAEVTLSQILRPNLDFSPNQTIRPWQPQLWPWAKRLSPDFSRDSAVEWRLSRLSLQTLYKYSNSSPFLHVERVCAL